jgi:hypothetical protein
MTLMVWGAEGAIIFRMTKFLGSHTLGLGS